MPCGTRAPIIMHTFKNYLLKGMTLSFNEDTTLPLLN